MQPDTPLIVYEIRCSSWETLKLLEQKDLKKILGKNLLGYHLEAEFSFIFCLAPVNIKKILIMFPGLSLVDTHKMRYDDWQDGAHAEPIVIGPLSILPPSYSSNDFSPKDLAINQFGYERSLPPIILDPGLAFGYGGHRTTMSCLNFLLRVYSPKNKRKPQSVIDIGSGTGILSFAASRLGATKVIGVDNSRIAVDIAEVNVKNNNLSDIVSFIYGEARIFATEEGELLIANVPFSAMVELIDNNAFLNRRYVILSGIFPEQADIILSKLKKNFKYKILDSERDERWTSLLMENKEK